jgi:two-component system, OmpR family, alkaline phosphatase synthesis response regulator PhoP
MSERRILIVEDEAAIRRGVADALRSEGYAVLEAPDGLTGLAMGLREDPDLVILDLMMPGLDGFEVLRRWRDDGLDTPVIVLTARGLEEDRVKGLRLGADDYVVKPFGLDELLARVASRLRAWDRERGLTGRTTVRVGEATVDFRARTIRRGDETVNLTPKEQDLLRFFTSREGEALSRVSILDAVWGEDPETVSRVVDMTVLGLRRKLEADPASPRHVVTVPRIGYRFQRGG